MRLHHEAFVAQRFNALRHRFKPTVSAGDHRLAALFRALGPVQGLRVLDLGCGKGRFSHPLAAAGAQVVALDLTPAMLAHAAPLDRVTASALRLPFAAALFDGVVAIEVFQHLPPGSLYQVLAEIGRVLRGTGTLVVIDKNKAALDAQRPWLPRAFMKWVDERRGLWMYRPGEPAREHWFFPRRLARELACHFQQIKLDYLLTPEEATRALFRAFPRVRATFCLAARWSRSAK